MNLDWQNAAVLLLVAAACAYLARRAWLTMARRKAAACGSCSSCPADSAKGEVEVIALIPSNGDTHDTSGHAASNGARRP
jgi:hypothetical protein